MKQSQPSKLVMFIQLRPLLQRAGHSIESATTRLTTLADLTAYGSAHGITLTPKTKPAR
jgi:hypothetical protein